MSKRTGSSKILQRNGGGGCTDGTCSAVPSGDRQISSGRKTNGAGTLALTWIERCGWRMQKHCAWRLTRKLSTKRLVLSHARLPQKEKGQGPRNSSQPWADNPLGLRMGLFSGWFQCRSGCFFADLESPISNPRPHASRQTGSLMGCSERGAKGVKRRSRRWRIDDLRQEDGQALMPILSARS